MIREVSPALLPVLWSTIEPHFAAALEHHPFMNSEGLLERVRAGLAAVMVVLEGERIVGAVAMDIVQYPGKRVGNVLALGGAPGSMERYAEEVERFLTEWCIARSLDSLGTLGRPGWGKVLMRHGWQSQPLVAAWKDLR